MNAFYQTFYDLLETIEETVSKRRIIPCLILVYSGIDSFSYLASTSDCASGSIFKSWVKEWMLCQNILNCNEVDIYSARCALLHQQISESNLTRSKKAKAVYYSWGKKSSADLQAIIEYHRNQNTIVAVKVEDLVMSFRVGVRNCLQEIEKDTARRQLFEQKQRQMFYTSSFD